MNKPSTIFLLLTVLCSLLISCSEEPGMRFCEVKFSPSEYRFPRSGGHYVFQLDNQNYQEWGLTKPYSSPKDEKIETYFANLRYMLFPPTPVRHHIQGDWITLFKDEDSNLHVELTENNSGDERAVYVSIYYEEPDVIGRGSVVINQDKD